MNLFRSEPEFSMSADLLQRCREAGAIEPGEISDLLSVAPSTGYDYFGRSELRFGQFRTIFRFAKDDRVRDVFLADLLAGTDFVVVQVEKEYDVNGDGVVNFDDAIKGGVEQVAQAAKSLEFMFAAASDGKFSAEECDDLLGAFDQMIRRCAMTRNVVAYLRDLQSRRRRCRQRSLPLSGSASGGRA